MALLQGFPVVVLTVTTLAACAATKGSAAISPRAKLLNPFHTKRLSMMSPCIYVVQLRSRLIRPGVARGAMSGDCSRPPATIKTGNPPPLHRTSGARSRRIQQHKNTHGKKRVPNTFRWGCFWREGVCGLSACRSVGIHIWGGAAGGPRAGAGGGRGGRGAGGGRGH